MYAVHNSTNLLIHLFIFFYFFIRRLLKNFLLKSNCTCGRLSNSLCVHFLIFPKLKLCNNRRSSTSYEAKFFNYALFRNYFFFTFRLQGKNDDVLANESISWINIFIYVLCKMLHANYK